MKRIFTCIIALVLAASLTACANTATGPDMVPDGRAGSSYNTGTERRGNVSTTTDGRVNGVNRPARRNDGSQSGSQNGGSQNSRTKGGSARNGGSGTNGGTARNNTNAMGAGIQG